MLAVFAVVVMMPLAADGVPLVGRVKSTVAPLERPIAPRFNTVLPVVFVEPRP